jgi:hypothetical protein
VVGAALVLIRRGDRQILQRGRQRPCIREEDGCVVQARIGRARSRAVAQHDANEFVARGAE